MGIWPVTSFLEDDIALRGSQFDFMTFLTPF